MCITCDIFNWNAIATIGTCLAAFCTFFAVLRSLNLVPFKSHSLSGEYWFENGKHFYIWIKLTNNSRRNNNTFVPTQGALIELENDSRYLTLNSDKPEYLICAKTTRLLKIKTSKTAEAYKFLSNHPDYKLYIFTIDNQRILLKKREQPKGY